MRIALLAILLAVSAYLALAAGVPGEEDAFIYFRYALHWARGQGLAFNPGDPVEGFSGPVWMGLLALATGLGAEPHVFARAASLLCGLATVLAAAGLTARLGGGPVAQVGTAASLALSFWFVLWSQSGLETAQYSLALTLAVAATLRAVAAEPRPRRDWCAGLLLGVAALSRPEGPIAVPLTVWHARRRGLGVDRLLRLAIPALVLLSLCVAWRHATFHAWLPNTSVKLAPLQVARSVPQALEFILSLGLVAVVLPALAWAAPGPRGADPGGRLFVWSLGCALSLGFPLLVGGDYRPGFRYMMPALPLLLAPAWSTWDPLTRAWPSAARAGAAVALLGSLLAGSAAAWRANPPACWHPGAALARWRDPFAERGQWGLSAAWWLVEHVPDGSLVAYAQMGRAPYLLARRGRDVRFLDTAGWIDRDVAGIYRLDRKAIDLGRGLLAGLGPAEALAHGREARARRFVDLVLAREPDFVLIESVLSHIGLNELLPRDPRFIAGYARLEDLGPPPLIAVFRRRIPHTR